MDNSRRKYKKLDGFFGGNIRFWGEYPPYGCLKQTLLSVHITSHSSTFSDI